MDTILHPSRDSFQGGSAAATTRDVENIRSYHNEAYGTCSPAADIAAVNKPVSIKVQTNQAYGKVLATNSRRRVDVVTLRNPDSDETSENECARDIIVTSNIAYELAKRPANITQAYENIHSGTMEQTHPRSREALSPSSSQTPVDSAVHRQRKIDEACGTRSLATDIADVNKPVSVIVQTNQAYGKMLATNSRRADDVTLRNPDSNETSESECVGDIIATSNLAYELTQRPVNVTQAYENIHSGTMEQAHPRSREALSPCPSQAPVDSAVRRQRKISSVEERHKVLIATVTVLNILISDAVIILCILIFTGVISFTVNPTKVTGNSSSCQCEGAIAVSVTWEFSSISLSNNNSQAENSTTSPDQCNCTLRSSPKPFSNELLDKTVNQLSEDIHDIVAKVQTATIMARRRIEELLLQVMSINKTVEQIIPTTQTPPTPDISGLALPAQISINMSTGCEQTTVSEEINLYSHELNFFKYFDETHVIVDITCELELNGKPSRDGVGVVVSKSTSNSNNAFQYLSEVEMQCICYYWDPGQKQGNTGAYCRLAITKCSYKKQPFMYTVITT